MKQTSATPASKAAEILAVYLEQKHPDFVTFSHEQATDFFSCSVYRVWSAWRVLTGRDEP